MTGAPRGVREEKHFSWIYIEGSYSHVNVTPTTFAIIFVRIQQRPWGFPTS